MSRGGVEGRAEQLVEVVGRYAGSSLRGSVWYDSQDLGVVSIRDDVAEQYTDEEITAATKDLELDGLGDPARLENRFHLGEHQCTVRWFEDGLLVHVPFDEQSGAAVSFDHDVAGNLSAIVAAASTFVDR